VTAVLPDAVLGDRYRLTERIAGGGMGQVWRGVDLLLDRLVAVKLLREEYSDSEEFRGRLHAEARAAAVLHHPNVATVFDYGETPTPDGRCRSYLVMQLVDGQALSDLLAAARGRWPVDRALGLLTQAAAALAAAHRAGLVHRDVKPANLLVGPDDHLTITDFGIARAAGAVPLTSTGATVGTPDYMAPEQVNGSHVGPPADLYALGLVGYEMLAGHKAFAGETPVARAFARVHGEPAPLPDDVPVPLQALIADLLSRRPEDRPDDAELGRRLHELTGSPLLGVPAAVLADAAVGAGPSALGAAAMPTSQGPATDPAAPAPTTEIPAQPPDDAGNRSRLIRPDRRAAWFAAAVPVLAIIAFVLVGGATAAPGLVRVPRVLGAQLAQARATLARHGLTVRVHAVDVPRESAGTVTGERPGPGAKVDKHSAVTLTVASGYVRVPRTGLVGTTYAAATGRLARLGLTTTPRMATNSRKAGTVLRVDRTGRVRVGSSIPLTVSSGPAHTVVVKVRAQPRRPSGHHQNPGPGHGPSKHHGPGHPGGPVGH
jgi:beta-lactam-binding protein with PASTA domain